MIDGAAFFAWSKRSRTREAPTPTIISTNSEADMEKKGTPASPATARASNVFPVPGAPLRSTPRGMRAPSLRYFVGIAEEVDDFGELLLRLLDPGDVVERDALLRGLVLLRLRASEAAEHAAACTAGAAHEPDEESEEEQRRPEVEEHRQPPRRLARRRLRDHLDAVLLQQSIELGAVGELGYLGREAVVAVAFASG